MNASSGNTGAAARNDQHKPARTRRSQYMIAPAAPGMTRQALVDRLGEI